MKVEMKRETSRGRSLGRSKSVAALLQGKISDTMNGKIF
jgi:hypothetical protein